MNEFTQLIDENKKSHKIMEEIFQRLEKVQRLYEELNKYIERENKRYKDLSIQLFEKKEEKLVEINKQRPFQKILGNFFNKISGAKRFSKSVIEDISHSKYFIITMPQFEKIANGGAFIRNFFLIS